MAYYLGTEDQALKYKSLVEQWFAKWVSPIKINSDYYIEKHIDIDSSGFESCADMECVIELP